MPRAEWQGMNNPAQLETLHAEVDALAGGLHVLAAAVANDADLRAQCLLLARQVERVAEHVEELERAACQGATR